MINGDRHFRPGRGWKHVAGSVYDHASGVRLHLSGMVRLPNGDHVSANEWPESSSADHYVLLNGGNRKRGLMAWARAKVGETDDTAKPKSLDETKTVEPVRCVREDHIVRRY
jgi:hypothetical protein